ncbi:MAG: metal ABC transporter ATP-binding protein [Pseudomonadota bacterium]
MLDRDEHPHADRGGGGCLGGYLGRYFCCDLMTALLTVSDLALGYAGRTLFDDLSFDIDKGKTLAVLGHNGSGKSTFVKALLGLIRPMAGQFHWHDGRPTQIGYLAQMTEFDRRFPIRVRDLVAMGAWKGLGLRAGLYGAARLRMEAAMDATGVLGLANAPLHTLSVGQLQRTLFARVMMQDAPLVLLDEPFAAVDQTTEAHLLSIIHQWTTEGRTVVLVVHSLSSVLHNFDEVLLLGSGMATHGPVDHTLSPERLVVHNYLSQNQADWIFRRPPEPMVSGDA